MREPLTQSTPASDLPRVGRYEILFDLHEDGFVARHLARVRGPTAGPEVVELGKVNHALSLEAEVRAAFFAEARAAGRVRHVNFVQPLDTLSVDGDLYVATDLTGVRLDEFWRAARAEGFEIPLAVHLRILLDVLAGISALHAAASGGAPRPLVHGDVCPANIAIGYRGESRLVHSGLSSAASRVGPAGRRNERLPYKAPEQLRAGVQAMPIGPGADVFAVGVMLWEALEKESPFDAATDVDVVERICFGALPTPPPSEGRFTHLTLLPLVRAALERNPEHRILDVAELADAIERTHNVRAAAVEEVALALDRVLGSTIEQRRHKLEEALARVEKAAPDGSPLGADSPRRAPRTPRTLPGFPAGGPASQGSAFGNWPSGPSSTPASHTVRLPSSPPPRSTFAPPTGQGPMAPSVIAEPPVSSRARLFRRKSARFVGFAYALGLAIVLLAVLWMLRLDRQSPSPAVSVATPRSDIVPAVVPPIAPEPAKTLQRPPEPAAT